MSVGFTLVRGVTPEQKPLAEPGLNRDARDLTATFETRERSPEPVGSKAYCLMNT